MSDTANFLSSADVREAALRSWVGAEQGAALREMMSLATNAVVSADDVAAHRRAKLRFDVLSEVFEKIESLRQCGGAV